MDVMPIHCGISDTSTPVHDNDNHNDGDEHNTTKNTTSINNNTTLAVVVVMDCLYSLFSSCIRMDHKSNRIHALGEYSNIKN